jgi:hypothetical protein
MVCIEEGALPLYLFRFYGGLESISGGNPACHLLCMLSRHRLPKEWSRGARGGAPAPRVWSHPDRLSPPSPSHGWFHAQII